MKKYSSVPRIKFQKFQRVNADIFLLAPQAPRSIWETTRSRSGVRSWSPLPRVAICHGRSEPRPTWNVRHSHSPASGTSSRRPSAWFWIPVGVPTDVPSGNEIESVILSEEQTLLIKRERERERQKGCVIWACNVPSKGWGNSKPFSRDVNEDTQGWLLTARHFLFLVLADKAVRANSL